MPLTRKEISQRQRDRKAANGVKEVRELYVPTLHHNIYKDALKAFIGDIEIESCFSCDNDFILLSNNDRDEGYFCDDCLYNPSK